MLFLFFNQILSINHHHYPRRNTHGLSIVDVPSHSGNYGNWRAESSIKCIVIHYTANNGDTARGNGKYFQSNRGVSAHYFVDENEIIRSVSDTRVAYHSGTSGKYYHPFCRNSNSIGIEMVSRKDSNNNYYIKSEVIHRTLSLTKSLMSKYKIPIDNVVRHYDITGKYCPAPFVHNPNQWTDFKKKLI